MRPLSKQMQLFLVPEDEREISEAVRALRPKVTFLDDNIWPGIEPLSARSISECQSRLVYLWDQGLVAQLPTITRPDGRLEGPVAGPVIQIVRSRQEGGVLLSGRVAAGTGGMEADLESSVRAFIADVWSVVRRATPGTLSSVDGRSGRVIHRTVKEYRAGRHAVKWIEESVGRAFKDRSTPNYYRPAA